MQDQLLDEALQCRLSASGTVGAGGEFEILAITTGAGNGWEFGETCLQDSLALWDGAECFVDHAWYGHSVRDLAGVCHSPEWDTESKGVKARLKAVGPSAGLLTELGRQMLAETGKKPRVGFSADVLFTAQGRKVQKLLRVLSVDLVFDPARGGAFKRALNSVYPNQQEAVNMGEDPKAAPVAAQLASAQPAQASPINQEELEAILENKRVPAPVREEVRKSFIGRTMQAADVEAAVQLARSVYAAATNDLVVQGPRRLSGMFSTEDQIEAAVEDLFGIPRSRHLQGLKAARLSGVRELYLTLTGDDDLHGGFYPNRVRLATTADFTGLVKNAMNKIVVNTWEQLGRAGYDWWMKVAAIEHFTSLNQITGTLVGTVGGLPVVAEGAAYTELQVGDSPETGTFKKYGGYIPLTLELIDRDETRRLKAYPRELAAAGLRNISKQIAEIFTFNNGAGTIMADGSSIFSVGHKNLGSSALDAASWEAGCQAIYNQEMLNFDNNEQPKMAINPRYLLVPRALQLTAKKILYPSLENAANITSENQQQGQPGDVITVPEWTDANNWAAAVDQALAPAIYVGERFGLMPQVFIAGNELSPAVFTNDEHRLKVRHLLAVWVNDFRPLYKANVA